MRPAETTKATGLEEKLILKTDAVPGDRTLGPYTAGTVGPGIRKKGLVEQMQLTSQVWKDVASETHVACLSANDTGSGSVAGVNGSTSTAAHATSVRTGAVAPSSSGWGESISYYLENRLIAHPSLPFLALTVVSAVLIAALGLAWYLLSDKYADKDGGEMPLYGEGEVWDALYLSLQVVISAGFEDIPSFNGLRFLYAGMVCTGALLFAVLVGLVSDTVSTGMVALREGRTKVSARNHTLVLGWNDATARLVVQLCVLRRRHRDANQRSFYYYLPFLWFLRARESCPAAANAIILLNNTRTKQEMHSDIAAALAECGISSALGGVAAIGRDIICRVGDPASVTDLAHAGLPRAASVVVMMGASDAEDCAMSAGRMESGASVRVVLALRHVLSTGGMDRNGRVTGINPSLRVALQLTTPSPMVDAASFAHPRGRDVLFSVDMCGFLARLPFACAATPFFGAAVTRLLQFNGPAIRCCHVSDLQYGPKAKVGAAVGQKFSTLHAEYLDAVIIGVVDSLQYYTSSSGGTEQGSQGELSPTLGYGLCPHPDLVLRGSDLVVFVANTPTLVPCDAARKAFEAYASWSVTLRKTLSQSNIKRARPRKYNNMLVCGWRAEWTHDVHTISARLLEMAGARTPDSTLTFLTTQSHTAFAGVMEDCGLVPATAAELSILRERVSGADATSPMDFTRPPVKVTQSEATSRRRLIESCLTPESHMFYRFTSPAYTGVWVRHVCGDATVPLEMEQVVLKGVPTHTAIVLGTNADDIVAAPARHRDTRVLSSLLLLRKLTLLRQNLKSAICVPLHVIGENMENLTAALALTPVSANRLEAPYKVDFVNAHALSALVLAQVLAAPLLTRVLGECFCDPHQRGAARVEMVLAGTYLPTSPPVPIEWGVAVRMCLLAPDEECIAVGFVSEDGAMQLNPPHSFKRAFKLQERLVVVRRVTSVEQLEQGDSVPAAPGFRGDIQQWPSFGS
jgi:hypothetical protein